MFGYLYNLFSGACPGAQQVRADNAQDGHQVGTQHDAKGNVGTATPVIETQHVANGTVGPATTVIGTQHVANETVGPAASAQGGAGRGTNQEKEGLCARRVRIHKLEMMGATTDNKRLHRHVITKLPPRSTTDDLAKAEVAEELKNKGWRQFKELKVWDKNVYDVEEVPIFSVVFQLATKKNSRSHYRCWVVAGTKWHCRTDHKAARMAYLKKVQGLTIESAIKSTNKEIEESYHKTFFPNL